MSREPRDNSLSPLDVVILFGTLSSFYEMQVRPSVFIVIMNQVLFGWSMYIVYRVVFAAWFMSKQEPPRSNK